MYPQPPQNHRAQLRGRQSRAQGGLFEQIIDASCLYYQELGLAEIQKTPEPTRQLGPMNRQGQFQACYEKQAQPDYKGVLQGGRAIVFEAKHTDSDRIQRNRVTPEQSAALGRCHKLGAACYVLISIQMQSFALLPWAVWQNMKEEFGHMYINEKDLAPYRVGFNGRVVAFLDKVERRRESMP